MGVEVAGKQFVTVDLESIARRGCGGQVTSFGAIPEGPRVGVVGSRDPMPEQLAATRDIVAGLVQAGAIVVSGGARGIDEQAHRHTVELGGKTAVVLPAGLLGVDKRQAVLCRFVRTGGGIVMSREKPLSGHMNGSYRRRNAVLVRLIDALVVVCADLRSGTLMTANMARQQQIPVFVVPWRGTDFPSAGSNELLRLGCRLVSDRTGARTLVADLGHNATIDGAAQGWQRYATPKPRGRLPLVVPQGGDSRLVSAIDQALATTLDTGLSLEELVSCTGGTRSELAALLLRLCMDGQLQRASFGRYRRA